MFIVQFSFEVPENKIQEFLVYSGKVLKKTWEAYGCRSYTAYRNVGRRIRSNQIVKENEIIEQIIFDSLDDAERMFDPSNLKPEDLEVAKSYEERCYVRNMQCRILEMLQ